MNPILSIIVPVYNGEEYLSCCLESLLGQSLRDIEVVLVDDGSTDDTSLIGMDFARRDARLRYVSMERNMGVSAARNRGLDMARGGWIGFCDADDFVDPDMHRALLSAAENAKAQVAFCPVVKQRPGGDEIVRLPWPGGTIFRPEDIRADLIPGMISMPVDSEDLPVSGYTPRNIFARPLLEGLRFWEDIHYAEDLLFIVLALMRAEGAVCTDKPLYTYRFHGNSVTQRYVPDLEREHEQCHRALDRLFRQEGLSAALDPRMEIRRRRAALALVSNSCRPGCPFNPLENLREISRLLRLPEITSLFADLRLGPLPAKLRIKYACMKKKWAFPLLLFYRYLYRSR